MNLSQTAVRLAAVAGQVARLQGAGPPPRAQATIGGVVVVDLGVAAPWSVQAHLPSPAPGRGTLEAAVAWCRERGGERGYRVSVPGAEHARVVELGLVPHEEMGVYAMPAGRAVDLPALDLPALDLPRLELGDAADRAELVAAYGGWMSDVPLANSLVHAEDLTSPSRRFIVARLDGRPVGCALVWFAAGTAYLSGIGVVPELRRRGYGRGLTDAATRVGVAGPGSGPRPDLVWMHATPDGAALYSAMGFERVDVHVLMGPPADNQTPQ